MLLYALATLCVVFASAKLIAMAFGAIAAGTVAFAVLGLVAFLVVSAVWRNDKDDAAVARLAVIMSFIAMYIMWVTCYLCQMHPLIRPTKA